MHPVADMAAFESVTGEWLRLAGTAIDVFGVAVTVIGIVWSTAGLVRHMAEDRYHAYKVRIGRSLLLGLEVLVAADIVKTIALDPTFAGLGLLGGLVVVRTCLGWTLVLEIEGRWPWQAKAPKARPD